MSPDLPTIPVARKTGDESFHQHEHPLALTLRQFWQWSCSDLVHNVVRGQLAEFLVACALGVADETQPGWNAYDLVTTDGIKVEVKSSAYVQSWMQKRYSAIVFDIRPTQGWDARTNEFSTGVKRHADVYVFCVLSHQDARTLDPLNLDHWECYVLLTSVLNEQVPTQKSICLSRLLALHPTKVWFDELASCLRALVHNHGTT